MWTNLLCVFPYTKLAAEGHQESPQAWQRAFQRMRRPFHMHRGDLFELTTTYDESLATQKQRAEQDPSFRERCEHYTAKSRTAKAKGSPELEFDKIK